MLEIKKLLPLALAVSFLVGWGGASLHAENEPLDEPVSLTLTDSSPHEVLRVMAATIDHELDLDRGVTGSITLDMDNAPWREVMDEICAQLDCRWEIRDDPPALRVEKAAS